MSNLYRILSNLYIILSIYLYLNIYKYIHIMVNYTCYRCDYTTAHKSKILLHLNRKHTCKTSKIKLEIQDIQEYILKGLTFDEYKKIIQQTKKQALIKSKSSLNQVENKPEIVNINQCTYCNKTYMHNQSLYKHLKTCKDKKTDDEVKDSMAELVKLLNDQLHDKNDQISDFKKELTKRDKQIEELIKKAGITNNSITNSNGNTDNSTTIIQNNSIKILSYSDTDRSHLTDKDILKCLKHSNFCIPYLIEKIHFDANKPENHNIYISNLKNKYIMIYDGDKWICKDRDEQINNLIDDNEGVIEYKIEEWIENGNKFPKMMQKFNTYVGIKDNNMVINKIKDEIKLLLYNNRNVVNTDILAINNCKNSNLMNC